MFRKIESGSSFEGILKQIIENVKTKKIKAGAELPSVGSMAEAMDVSEEEIKAALRTLGVLGIAKSAPGNRYYIAENLGSWISGPLAILFQLNNSYVRQGQQLRSALEIEAAIVAARKCTPLDAVQLLGILNNTDNAETPEERDKMDHELHVKIAEIADNPLIANILYAADELVSNIISETSRYIFTKKQTIIEINEQHRKIVEAIIANDEKAAGENMYEHMRLTEICLSEMPKIK